MTGLVDLHLDPHDGNLLAELPPYCRPSPLGTYWHMPRSAAVVTRPGRGDRLLTQFWCGQTRTLPWGSGAIVAIEFTDAEPPDEVCATCFGRAQAYHEPATGLRFQPRDHFKDPTWCPFSGVWPAEGGRDCPLCGYRLTHARGWTASGCARHKVEGRLSTEPCPSHGWQRIRAYPDGLTCGHWQCEYSTPWGAR